MSKRVSRILGRPLPSGAMRLANERVFHFADPAMPIHDMLALAYFQGLKDASEASLAPKKPDNAAR
jgi:hypothetical protein